MIPESPGEWSNPRQRQREATLYHILKEEVRHQTVNQRFLEWLAVEVRKSLRTEEDAVVVVPPAVQAANVVNLRVLLKAKPEIEDYFGVPVRISVVVEGIFLEFDAV